MIQKSKGSTFMPKCGYVVPGKPTFQEVKGEKCVHVFPYIISYNSIKIGKKANKLEQGQGINITLQHKSTNWI